MVCGARFYGMDAVYLHDRVNPDEPKGKDEFSCYREVRQIYVGYLGSLPISHIWEWMFERPSLESLPYVQGNITKMGRSKLEYIGLEYPFNY